MLADTEELLEEVRLVVILASTAFNPRKKSVSTETDAAVVGFGVAPPHPQGRRDDCRLCTDKPHPPPECGPSSSKKASFLTLVSSIVVSSTAEDEVGHQRHQATYRLARFFGDRGGLRVKNRSRHSVTLDREYNLQMQHRSTTGL